MLMPFDPSEHRHRFAAWAAGRAASVKGQRFSVQSARSAIELAGVREFGSNPPPDIDVGEFDRRHDQWRIDIAGALNVRHGVAAKLINIYLKALFLSEIGARPTLLDIAHPPIDELLLKALDHATERGLWRERPSDANGNRQKWYSKRWSKLESGEYCALIADIRTVLGNRPFWLVEEYWPGAQ